MGGSFFVGIEEGNRSIGGANLRKGAALQWPARPVPGWRAPCPPRAARNGRKKSRSPSGDCGFFIQAWVGIEPTVKLLQSHALPLGYHAVNKVLLSEKIFAIASFFIPFPEDGGNTRTST